MCQQTAAKCWRWEGGELRLHGAPHMSGWSQGGGTVRAAEHPGGSQGDGALQDPTWPGLDVRVCVCDGVCKAIANL